MQAKALEIRDVATFLPILAVDMNPGVDGQRYLLRRCGYPCDGGPNIIITPLHGNGRATNDPYEWADRTFSTAHHYILDNWASLKDGDVIDVEFILHETKAPKVSEQYAP